MLTGQLEPDPRRLRACRVLRVEEQRCEIWDDGAGRPAEFAPMFPAPRVDRVSPGHLVAVVTAADGRDMIVWRWFDAVVLGENTDGSIRLWEPAHGEIAASPRTTYVHQEPGSRAYVSAGLPGAQWWVADIVDRTAPADVELTEVEALFTENDLWAALRL